MKVQLAGLNIDKLLLEKAAAGLGDKASALTPETISASYARISRSKKSIKEIRENAIDEVEKARKSNRRIIFDMGHASISEHAVFNFDVEGISRLAVEYIESFRLASFTEKSQRYVLFGEEYYMPESLKGTSLEGKYQSTIHELAMIYGELFKKLKASGVEEESAKEDSRYATPLATLTQFGMTLNARNLEYMIVRLNNSPFGELRDYARSLYSSIRNIAPSLVKYVGEDSYYRNQGIKPTKGRLPGRGKTEPQVHLIDWTRDGEEKIVSSILFQEGNLEEPFKQTPVSKYFRRIFVNMDSFHPLPRVFEMAACTFVVECSASAFAQLKRHRMATLIPQGYDLELGYTVPPSIEDAGLESLLLQAYNISNTLYSELNSLDVYSAPYILTNSHRRKVLFKADLRELYHIARLRSDLHAQWEIRMISDKMVSLAREKFPEAMALACGKDGFDEVKRKYLSSHLES